MNHRIPAKELKRTYGAYGRFYTLELGGSRLPCRSTLELVRHDRTPLTPTALNQAKPDLLVVMMNPGGSRPLQAEYIDEVVRAGADCDATGELVPTQPDVTQYQIMRLMAVLGVGHARVVNLSDIREPKSPRFIELYRQAEQQSCGDAHSVFSSARVGERTQLSILAKEIPVVAGWGRAPELRPLAMRARSALSAPQLHGIPASDDGVLFAHPSPMLQSAKDQWLNTLVSQMASSGA